MNKPFSIGINKVFGISIVLTLGWMILMSMSVKPFNSKQIVAFELAKTPEVATNIINEWKEQEVMANASRSIYLDFVFLVLYSFSISLGCLVLSKFTDNVFLLKLGFWLSRIMIIAGFSDVIENIAMLKTLSGEITIQTTAVAYWFAIIKFSIVIVSLLFVLGCLIFVGIKKILAK